MHDDRKLTNILESRRLISSTPDHGLRKESSASSLAVALNEPKWHSIIANHAWFGGQIPAFEVFDCIWPSCLEPYWP
ncbi:hypothetical protein VTI28DRAFT_6323 [Corynascus sepedonium]